jgi:hypothetical protein
VTPASYIPAIAKEWNAIIVENNPEPTRLTATLTDHFLQVSAGKLLPPGSARPLADLFCGEKKPQCRICPAELVILSGAKNLIFQ